jgi:hypothetical protein
MSSMSSTPIARTAGTIRRFPLWARIVGVIVILALVAFAVITLRMNYVPDNLDLSTTRMSEQGIYQVSYVPELEPVPINQIQTWTIRVTEPDGQPVEDADMTVDGGMPQHGHGLPTVPQVTEYLGDGLYQIEGMKFNMPGWWVLTFEIVRNGTTDAVTFNLMLD